jgi:hypothetical protein
MVRTKGYFSSRPMSLALSFCMALFGCSNYNGSGIVIPAITTTTATAQSPVTITTSGEGAAAAAAVLQAKEVVVTSTTIFKDLGFITQSQMASAVTSSGTGTCADFGTYAYDTTYNSTSGNYSVSYTFNLCRQNGLQYDGSYSASGNAARFTGRLAGLKIMNFQNDYKTLIGSLSGSSLSYIMAGSGIASNATYTITANGGMQAFDYYALGQHNMNFNGLVTNYAVSVDATTNTQTASFTTNGKYSVTRSGKTAALTYTDFKLNIQKQTAANIEDLGMAGRVAVNYTPDTFFEGIFDITTSSSIRTTLLPFPPKTSQGTFMINNAAIAQFENSDRVGISVAGDAPLTFAKEFMLMKQADFYGMEQQLPIVSGATGTASGSIMSISALSTGPDLNCYTDVHVKYYSAANLPTPQLVVPDNYLWIVHWDSNLNTCTPTSAISYQEATSSTGVATDPCDVGLDINGSAQDVTSGGVEHFLAAALPAGYYVLSIDNYSCPTTVANAATLLVGDYLFGTYTCTYGSSDTDRSNAAAWCRLADVRVNTDGTIDVLAPDQTLTPWH